MKCSILVPFCMIMQFSILFMTLHLVRSFQMTSILHLKVGLHRKIVVFQSSLFRCSVSFRCFREGKGVKPNDFCRITCYLSLATNVIRSATRSMDMQYGYNFCKAREFLKQSSFGSVTLGDFKHPKMVWDETRPLHGKTHLIFFC